MTREEAKNWLNKLYARSDITDEYGDMEDMQPYEEAVNMAIKALEQKPKTGHWKKIATYPLYECSKCKLESMLNTWDYCPNCGCHMVESWESEDKE